MKKLLLFISLVTLSSIIYAQSEDVTIAFYNVENLFDTINDPQIKDEEFIPQGYKHWTSERYHK